MKIRYEPEDFSRSELRRGMAEVPHRINLFDKAHSALKENEK